MAALRFTWVPLVALLVVAGGLSLALALGSLPSSRVPDAKTAWRPASDLAGPRLATVDVSGEPESPQTYSVAETNQESEPEISPAALSALAPAAGSGPAPIVAAEHPPETMETVDQPPYRAFQDGLASFRTADMADGGLPAVTSFEVQSPALDALPEVDGQEMVEEEMVEEEMPHAMAEPLSLAGYVVIGSFRSRARADALAERHAAWQPTIQQAEVAGVVYHRVLVGPFHPSELDSALERIKAAGVADAWRFTVKPRDGRTLMARSLDLLG